MVYRVPACDAQDVLTRLWAREMPMSVYEPRWLPCPTPQGTVRALAFTLAREHPSYTGSLSEARLREIFQQAVGRFGSTRNYAEQTLQALREIGIEDRALARLIRVATA
jgi:cation transport protein ChaC